jgi:hypothetical protein
MYETRVSQSLANFWVVGFFMASFSLVDGMAQGQIWHIID